MEEFKPNTETEQEKAPKKKVWIIVVVSIVAFIVGFFIYDSIINSVSTPELEVSGTTLYVEYSEYIGYTATIKGIAKNNTNKNYSYASVEFSVYDSAGNNLGTAMANINNLAKGDTWRFEAIMLSFPSVRPTSFKLADITVW